MARTFKVVVVGDACVGKTCLLYRLRFGSMPRGRYLNTIGCEFFTHTVGEAALCVWDTAGHDSFRDFTPSFLRGAHVCIVCVDLSQPAPASRIDSWVDEASRVPGISIALAGTKADLPNSISPPQLQGLAARHSAVLCRRTSALTGEGVAGLFDDVAAHLSSTHPPRSPPRAAASPRAAAAQPAPPSRGGYCACGCC